MEVMVRTNNKMCFFNMDRKEENKVLCLEVELANSGTATVQARHAWQQAKSPLASKAIGNLSGRRMTSNSSFMIVVLLFLEIVVIAIIAV